MRTRETFKYTNQHVEELAQAYKTNKYPTISKKLHALLLRSEGKSVKEVCDITKISHGTVSSYTKIYFTQGIEGLLKETRGGRNKSYVSKEEEVAFLNEILEDAEEGKYVTAIDILEEFNKKFGVNMALRSFYFLLKRNGWRKVKGRSEHPKKASPTEIESAKKLTPKPKN